MVLETVYEQANNLVSKDKSVMTAIKTKCWVHHSESRVKNGNEPFTYVNFNHRSDKGLYTDYINLNLIDCGDIGGKEVALMHVNNWFQ